MSDWNVVTPQIYRYLPREYVDAFFKSGEIRLSSFSTFSRYSDEEKGDNQEGKHITVGTSQKNTVFAVTRHGSHQYILSSSTILSKKMSETFNSDACIHIKDSIGFALAIANKLRGFRRGTEGFCYYKDGPIETNIEGFRFDQLKNNPNDKNIDMVRLKNFVLNMASIKVFFKKRLKYQHQSEYRLVWEIDHEVKEPVTIICPEALEYCEPIHFG